MAIDLWLAQLGQRVRTLRNRRGLTQVELAEKAGIARSFIAELETAGRNISISNLRAIAQALDLSLSRLLSGL
jgi:transcriptional regulator with XRE-family HTH domain